MKTTMLAIGCGLGVCLLLGAANTAAAPGPCSNSILKGGYAFLYRNVGPLSSGVIQMGRLDSDGSGKFTEVFTSNQAGVTTHQTSTGTYTVNPDCSGTFVDTAIPGTQFVILDAGDRVATVTTQFGVPASKTYTGQMQRISLGNSTPCSDASLKGVFFSVEDGVRAGNFGDIVFDVSVGNLTAFVADGAGSAVGRGIGTTEFSDVYTVNPDCTGSYDRRFVGGTFDEHADFVISGDGRMVYGVITDAGSGAVQIVAQKQDL